MFNFLLGWLLSLVFFSLVAGYFFSKEDARESKELSNHSVMMTLAVWLFAGLIIAQII